MSENWCMIQVKSKRYDWSQKTKWFDSRSKNYMKPIHVIRVTRTVIRVTWFKLDKLVIQIRLTEATRWIFGSMWFETSIHVIWIREVWFKSEVPMIWLMKIGNALQSGSIHTISIIRITLEESQLYKFLKDLEILL